MAIRPFQLYDIVVLYFWTQFWWRENQIKRKYKYIYFRSTNNRTPTLHGKIYGLSSYLRLYKIFNYTRIYLKLAYILSSNQHTNNGSRVHYARVPFICLIIWLLTSCKNACNVFFCFCLCNDFLWDACVLRFDFLVDMRGAQPPVISFVASYCRPEMLAARSQSIQMATLEKEFFVD